MPTSIYTSSGRPLLDFLSAISLRTSGRRLSCLGIFSPSSFGVEALMNVHHQLSSMVVVTRTCGRPPTRKMRNEKVAKGVKNIKIRRKRETKITLTLADRSSWFWHRPFSSFPSILLYTAASRVSSRPKANVVAALV